DGIRDRNVTGVQTCALPISTSFDWAPTGADRIDLVAASLDTAATVVLNGRRLAEVQNQHRSWRFDVTDVLGEGSNRLEIHFASRSEERRVGKEGRPMRVQRW